MSDVLFVGIDPSLSCTAFVAQMGGEPWVQLVRQQGKGEIAPNVGVLNAVRDVVANEVFPYITTGLTTYVCIEEPGGLRGHSLVNMAVYRAIIQALCNEKVGSVYLLKAAPSQVKKFVTNSGLSKTSEVTSVVAQRWAKSVKTLGVQEDALMAIAMMQMSKCAYDVERGLTVGEPEPISWTKFQFELIVRMIEGTNKQTPRLVRL